MSDREPKAHPLVDLVLPPPRTEVVSRLNEQHRRITEAIERGESDLVAEGSDERLTEAERAATGLENDQDVARRLDIARSRR